MTTKLPWTLRNPINSTKTRQNRFDWVLVCTSNVIKLGKQIRKVNKYRHFMKKKGLTPCLWLIWNAESKDQCWQAEKMASC